MPSLAAVALVAFAVSRIQPDAFLDALARVDPLAYITFSIAFVFALLAADSFATVLVYRGAGLPVRYRDFFVLRGASYLPSLLNHHVGQAFLTLALSRAHGASLARTAGSTLLVYASWLGCLLLLAAVTFPLHGASLAWTALTLAPGVLYLGVLTVRPALLARTRLLAPLFEAGVRGHLVALITRLPHLAVLFLGTWIPFSFFGVHIPLTTALVRVPVLMVAVTLPITPQGLGTRDLLAPPLFEAFTPGDTHEARLAVLSACTTSWAAAITLVEAVLGLALLRSAMPRVMTSRAHHRTMSSDRFARSSVQEDIDNSTSEDLKERSASAEEEKRADLP
ncbi:lysylphosphatidylglycerol synthase domain-containing protein [Chondromyces crocatus]|uniref:lysylphosphatidylglycerol synthase domain-containing protein n=1 Tax=Chondromyces crocatus TaxID=52 RepID=UPI00067DD9DA|nr:lysylphosphatidylglycerol synthase domain-containing protein [Chondromyces crocatus]